MTSLLDHYRLKIRPALAKDFSDNINAVPKVEKITINVGIGRVGREEKAREKILENLTKITGQKPVITKAKKSISSFKVREGMPVGAVVTLRGERMWSFLDKLIRITLPRVRDFRGLDEKIVDRQGNASLGFREHIVFPEIRLDEISDIHGLEVTVTTSAKKREDGLKLLRALGMPFKQTIKHENIKT